MEQRFQKKKWDNEVEIIQWAAFGRLHLFKTQDEYQASLVLCGSLPSVTTQLAVLHMHSGQIKNKVVLLQYQFVLDNMR